MKISFGKITSVGVFLLIYYIYMNSMRKLMIPFSGITIKLILIFVLVSSILASNGKIRITGNSDKIQSFSWILIAVYILFNNQSIVLSLVEGGLIQLYVMISFILFASSINDKWINTWFKWTEIFVMIHAIATIIFYFNSNLYTSFANYFFTGSTLVDCLKYYKSGWMCGLSSHFSSNGMILAIGFIVFFERTRFLKKKLSAKASRQVLIIYYACTATVLYALILSSKRSPLIAAFFAIAITFIFAQGKNIWKRLFILMVICLTGYTVYQLIGDKIPGLTTIMDKFNALEGTSAGVLNGRGGLWSLAIEMFESNPILGKGFGSYATYAIENGAITTSAHNYYLQILSELGLVGIVLYISAFVTGIVSTRNEIKVSLANKSQEEIMILSIALGIQIFVIIYCITSTALMYYYILIPYFLACSVPRTIRFNRNNLKNSIRSNKR